MANYFAVYNRRQQASAEPAERKTLGTAKVLPYQKGESSSVPEWSGQVEDALICKLEASSLAEAQNAMYGLFPGVITGTPVIVTEAQFKES